MKRIISIALFLCILVSLQSQEIYTTKNIPKVHLQDKTRYVCNPAGILSVSACGEIDRMLYALEQQTGIETVVAVVPSIGNEDCFEFSHQLLNEWGVGKKDKNNGLVILLVTDSDENSGESPIGLILAVIGFFAIAIVAGILKTRAASKCPQCGQHKLQRSNSVLVSRRNGVRTEDVTYTCRNCGHKVVRRQQSYDENYRGGGGGGPVIFGGGGFGGSGGGFSGGSFGGGMGGGGGAGSRF